MELTSERTEAIAQMQKWGEAARNLLPVSLLFLTDDVVPAVPHSGPYLTNVRFCFFLPQLDDDLFNPVMNLLVMLSLIMSPFGLETSRGEAHVLRNIT